MIRILFLLRSLDIGGAERQLVELVKNINHQKYKILVVTFYDGGALRKMLENVPNIRITSLGKSGRWDLFSFFFKLLKVTKAFKPDAIQSYLDVPNAFNVITGKILGVKSSLGASASYVDFSRYDWTAALVYKTSALLSHFSSIVIANSKAGEIYNINHGYSKKRMIVISNGIDTHLFHPDESGGLRMRLKWGIPRDDMVVGIVGRFDPMKDHSTFIKAASLVIKTFPDCRFVCVGKGELYYLDELKSFTGTLMDPGRVLWIENCELEDIPAAYNVFTLLVSSSYGEGLAGVIGEGMASGLPCVVTDVGDSAYAVGNHGLVVPPQDPALLAEGICSILLMNAEERLDLGSKARKRVQYLFSVEKMTAAYEAVFEELANS